MSLKLNNEITETNLRRIKIIGILQSIREEIERKKEEVKLFVNNMASVSVKYYDETEDEIKEHILLNKQAINTILEQIEELIHEYLKINKIKSKLDRETMDNWTHGKTNK